MTSNRNFFGTLSTDVRVNIVRKTSSKWRGEDWRRNVSVKTLKMLLHPQGPFSNEIGLLFTAIRLDLEDSGFWQGEDYRDLRSIDGLALCDADARTTNAVGVLSGALEAISFKSSLLVGTTLHQLMHRSRQIKVLSLAIDSASDKIWPKLLTRLAPELEVLDITGVNAAVGDLGADTEFPKLKELCVANWSMAREDENMDHGRIIAITGKQLEILRLSCDGVPEDKLPDILEPLWDRFPMLHTISTHGFSELILDYADLLSHYGTQIRRLDFNEIKDSDLVCTEAIEFNINLRGTVHMAWDLDSYAVLAPRLDECYILDIVYQDEFATIAKRCKELRRLEFLNCLWTTANFARFFDSFASPLTVLEISARATLFTAEVLSKMQASVSQLQRLLFFVEQVDGLDSLGKFLAATEWLEDLDFQLTRPILQADALEVSTHVLNSMKNRRNLKKLHVHFGNIQYSDKPKFDIAMCEEAQPFRFRSTYVRVQGVEYFI